MSIAAIRSGFVATVAALNQHDVKEQAKTLVSAITFLNGLIGIPFDCLILGDRRISTEVLEGPPKWTRVRVATTVAVACSYSSLLLSAATSRPGVWIISTFVGRIISSSQLERIFGPNTVFAVNPWHPRHVCSIAAVILAIPSVIHSTYLGIHSLMRYSIFSQQLRFHVECEQPSGQLSDREVRGMILFNTLTSRPIMHLGNQLCRAMVK